MFVILFHDLKHFQCGILGDLTATFASLLLWTLQHIFKFIVVFIVILLIIIQSFSLYSSPFCQREIAIIDLLLSL